MMIDPKFKSFITQVLRRASYKWPARTESLREARVSRGLYKCSTCGLQFKKKQVHMDHISPVIDVKQGFVDWNTYIARMFPPKSGFACLCTTCHAAKTSTENFQRKAHKSLPIDKKHKLK